MLGFASHRRVHQTGPMDAAFPTRTRPVQWPAALAGWGVTPVVAGLWALHEIVVVLGAAIPIPAGPPGVDGVPWFRWDVGWYETILRQGYERPAAAAFFPGVPAYLWVTHWPWVAFVGMQAVVLALIVMVGRLARAWGRVGGEIAVAQALVALAPAAVFYSTAYPEAWEALGLCGALLAMQGRRPWQAAAWSALAGLVDPMGLLVGASAGVWALHALWRRDARSWRDGIIWGSGSAAALAAVMAVLVANGRSPLGFIGAQSGWAAQWMIPGWPVIQAVAQPVLASSLAALALIPMLGAGLWVAIREVRSSPVRAAAVGIGVALFVLPLSFEFDHDPLASAARFLSLDIPAVIGLSGAVSLRVGYALVAFSGLWAIAGAVLFTHGWFWG